MKKLDLNYLEKVAELRGFDFMALAENLEKNPQSVEIKIDGKEVKTHLSVGQQQASNSEKKIGHIRVLDHKSFAERMANVSQNAQVGQFMFPQGNGIVSCNPTAGDMISGIVAFRSSSDEVGKRGLLIVPEEVQDLNWADSNFYFGCTDFDDGQSNCQKLLKMADEKKIKLPAIEYCSQYAKNGIMAGEGFMGAIKQLEEIANNWDIIRNSLNLIKASPSNGWMMSSSESSHREVLMVDIYDKISSAFNKLQSSCYDGVRCLVAF